MYNPYNFVSMEQLEFVTRSGIKVVMSDLSYATNFRTIHINSAPINDLTGYTRIVDGQFVTNVKVTPVVVPDYSKELNALRVVLLAVSKRKAVIGDFPEKFDDAVLNCAAELGFNGAQLVNFLNLCNERERGRTTFPILQRRDIEIERRAVGLLRWRTLKETQEKLAAVSPGVFQKGVAHVLGVVKDIQHVANNKAFWGTVMGAASVSTAALIWNAMGPTLAAVGIVAAPEVVTAAATLSVAGPAVLVGAIAGFGAAYLYAKHQTTSKEKYRVEVLDDGRTVRRLVRIHKDLLHKIVNEEILEEVEINAIREMDADDVDSNPAIVIPQAIIPLDLRQAPVYREVDESTLIPAVDPGKDEPEYVASGLTSHVATARPSNLQSIRRTALVTGKATVAATGVGSPAELEDIPAAPPARLLTLEESFARTLDLWGSVDQEKMLAFLKECDAGVRDATDRVKTKTINIANAHKDSWETADRIIHPEFKGPATDLNIEYFQRARLHEYVKTLGYESVGDMYITDNNVRLLPGAVEFIASIYYNPTTYFNDEFVNELSRGLMKSLNTSAFTVGALVEMYPSVHLSHFELRKWATIDFKRTGDQSIEMLKMAHLDDVCSEITHHLEIGLPVPFSTDCMYPLIPADISLLISGDGNQGYFVRKLVSLTSFVYERQSKAKNYIYRAIAAVVLQEPIQEFYMTDWTAKLPEILKMNETVTKWLEGIEAIKVRIRYVYKRLSRYIPGENRRFKTTLSIEEYNTLMSRLQLKSLMSYFSTQTYFNFLDIQLEMITAQIAEFRHMLVTDGPYAESRSLHDDPAYVRIAPYFYILWQYEIPGVIEDIIYLSNILAVVRPALENMNTELKRAVAIQRAAAPYAVIKKERVLPSAVLDMSIAVVDPILDQLAIPVPEARAVKEPEEVPTNLAVASLIGTIIETAETEMTPAAKEFIDDANALVIALADDEAIVRDLPVTNMLLEGQNKVLGAIVAVGNGGKSGPVYGPVRGDILYRMVEITSLVESSIFMLLERWGRTERHVLIDPSSLRECLELGYIVAGSTGFTKQKAITQLASVLKTTVKAIAQDPESGPIGTEIRANYVKTMKIHTDYLIDSIDKAVTVDDLLLIEPQLHDHINKLRKHFIDTGDLEDKYRNLNARISMLTVAVIPTTIVPIQRPEPVQPKGFTLSRDQRMDISLKLATFDPKYDYSQADYDIVTNPALSDYIDSIHTLPRLTKEAIVREVLNDMPSVTRTSNTPLIPINTIRELDADIQDATLDYFHSLEIAERQSVPLPAREPDLRKYPKMTISELSTLRYKDDRYNNPRLNVDNINAYMSNLKVYLDAMRKIIPPRDNTDYSESCLYSHKTVTYPNFYYAVMSDCRWIKITRQHKWYELACSLAGEWIAVGWVVGNSNPQYVVVDTPVGVYGNDTTRTRLQSLGVVYIAVSPSWYWNMYHIANPKHTHPRIPTENFIQDPAYSMYGDTNDWCFFSTVATTVYLSVIYNKGVEMRPAPIYKYYTLTDPRDTEAKILSFFTSDNKCRCESVFGCKVRLWTGVGLKVAQIGTEARWNSRGLFKNQKTYTTNIPSRVYTSPVLENSFITTDVGDEFRDVMDVLTSTLSVDPVELKNEYIRNVTASRVLNGSEFIRTMIQKYPAKLRL